MRARAVCAVHAGPGADGYGNGGTAADASLITC
jgi:hypothetical protein